MDREVFVRITAAGVERTWQVHFDKYLRPCAVEPVDGSPSDSITISMQRAVPAASEVLAVVRRHFATARTESYRMSA